MRTSSRSPMLPGALCAALVLSALAFAGPARPALADPPDTPFSPTTYPRVDGSTVTQPLGLAFQRAFTGQDTPSDAVVFSTTDRAYTNLIAGTKDLILVTYPSQDELDRAAAAGVDLEIIPVVDEGFVFLTNADNPVESLTLDQIRGIYSGAITNWSEVGGPDQPITAYQRVQNSGSQTGMEDLVMQGTPMVSAPMLEIPTMSGLVNLITASFNGDAGSLGYSYYYYVTAMYGDLANDPQLAKIKLMAVDGVLPTPETIRSGEYPVHTAYYIVIDKASPAGSPTRQLVEAMLGHDGQRTAMGAGYVPVDPTIPLPPPPVTDPNGLTSLEATYAVNPLTFSSSTEYVMGAHGCTEVTRLTVSGLADRTMQDDIDARFRAVQDSLAALTGEACSAPVPDLGYDTLYHLSATVGANFSNVLSLQTVLRLPNGFLTSDPVIGQAALNVRLDTGADLTAADVFTTTANVGGMIQLEAQASDPACDEKCANALAMTYRSDPAQPFGFTATSATIMGVTIPFRSYWPQVAIFNKYANVPAAYTAASPASCTVVSTAWSPWLSACVPVGGTPADFGTIDHVPWQGGPIGLPLPVGPADEWRVLAAGSRGCPNLQDTTLDGLGDPPAGVTPGRGVGPATLTVTMAESTSLTAQTETVCVVAIDQATRQARLGQISLTQDPVPARWHITVNPPDGSTVTTGLPSFSGTLTDESGAPLAGEWVEISLTGLAGAFVCQAPADETGAWSCTAETPLPNGAAGLSAQASTYSGDYTSYYWAQTDFTLTIAAPDAPATPVILAPTDGQTLYTGSLGGFLIRGTADPGVTVSVAGGACTVVADASGNWQCFRGVWANTTALPYTIAADATRGDARSPVSAAVAITADPRVGYGVAVTGAPADGVSTAEVTITLANTQRDASGNLVGGNPPPHPYTVTATGGDAAVRVITPSVDAAAGTATVRVVATQPGDHDVWIWVDGQPVALDTDNRPAATVLTFTAATPFDPKASTLTLSGDSVEARWGGCEPFYSSAITATATILDTSGRPMAGVPVDFSAQTPLTIASSSPTVSTDVNGVAEVTIESAGGFGDATPRQVHATVAGLDIAGSPAAVTVTGLEAIMPPPGVHASLVVAPTAGVGPVTADGKASWTATVQVVDGCDRPEDVPVAFTVTGSATPSAVQTVTGPDGVARITITDAVAEQVGVAAEFSYGDGFQPANGSPATIGFTAPVPAPPAPVVTAANAAWIAGTAVRDAGVVLTYPVAGGATKTVPVAADATGAWSVETPPDAVDGVLGAVAVDRYGQRSPVTSATLDVTAPPAPPLVLAGERVGGTAEANATVLVTWPDGTRATAAADGAGIWALAVPSGMRAGTITVTQTDPAGNTSPAGQVSYVPSTPPVIVIPTGGTAVPANLGGLAMSCLALAVGAAACLRRWVVGRTRS